MTSYPKTDKGQCRRALCSDGRRNTFKGDDDEDEDEGEE